MHFAENTRNRFLSKLFCLVYILFMGGTGVYFSLMGKHFYAAVGFAGILCGILPLILFQLTDFPIPLPTTVNYLLFLFAAQFMGSILNFYGLGWWDKVVHGFSGALLVSIAALISRRFMQQEKITHISPGYLFLFSLSFAALGGVLWEVYEFNSDHFFGTHMQIGPWGSNADTMTDLIAGFAGAVLMGLWNSHRIKKDQQRRNNPEG
jgi:hypothetical protein